MEKIKKLVCVIAITMSISVAVIFLFVVCSLFLANIRGITDDTAIKIIERDLSINLTKESAVVVYKEYDTNIREEGYTIICDIADEDTNRLLNSIDFEKTTVKNISEQTACEDAHTVMNEHYRSDETVYYKYGEDEFINGSKHIASEWTVILSPGGRLLLYASP